jgi:membrane protease YdiL (CAAX protease family)
MKKYSLKGWLFLTFVITWGIAAAYLLLPDTMCQIFGEISYSSPLFWIASYAPLIASILVIANKGGKKELFEFLKQIVQFKFELKWFLFIIICVPLITVVASIPTEVGIHIPLNMGFLITFLISNIFIGPLGEEPGWKGVALPNLLSKYSPLLSGIILGVIWAIWHLPAYMISTTPQGDHNVFVEYIGFVIIAIGFEILSTYIYIKTNGNIVASGILFHFVYNVSMSIFEPTHLYTGLVFILVAIFIIYKSNIQWFVKSNT